MVAWFPAAKTAMKVAPFALEAARQLDRQLRPHLLAYRVARDIDGFVGRWTSDEGAHWVVFATREVPLLRAFPPLPVGEVQLLETALDRAQLRHHTDLPEGRVRDKAVHLRRGLPGGSREPDDGGAAGTAD
jgi:hypothetical protein